MEIRGQGWCNYIVQDNWSSNKIREQLRLARKVIKEPLELINKLADDQVKLKGVLSVDSKQMEVINNLGYNQDRIQMLDDQLCTTYNELDVSMKALQWNLSRLQVKDNNSRQDYGTQRDAAV